jgi:hypothetical protein
LSQTDSVNIDEIVLTSGPPTPINESPLSPDGEYHHKRPHEDSDSATSYFSDGFSISPKIMPRKKTAINLDYNNIYYYQCCLNNCLTKLEAAEVQHLTKKISLMGQQEYQEWVVSKYKDATLNNIQTFKVTDTKTLCLNAWRHLFGVTDYFFEKLVKNENVLNAEEWKAIHANTGLKKPSEASTRAKRWLTEFIPKHCDTSPTHNHLYMPAYMNSSMLYKTYCESMAGENLRCLQSTQFTCLMNEDFKHVKFWGYVKMGRCDECLEFSNSSSKPRDPSELADFNKRRSEHTPPFQHEAIL